MRRFALLLSVVASSGLCSLPAYACQSCGCTLSDWSTEGYSPGAGVRFDYRFDYLNQDQLRTGTTTADHSTIDGSTTEIQQDTTTRFQDLSVDWSPTRDWGVNLFAPYLDRHHTTLSPGTSSISTSNTNGIGDMRLIGRYQGFLENRSVGVQFGLKLPTGNIHDNFESGPSAGQPLDRGLQNGTGTTDFIVGLFNGGALSRSFDRFEVLQVQTPLNSHEDFKPGTSVTANMGVRFVLEPWLMPQLQLNARWEGRESGVQADPDNSGSTTVMLSPGIAAGIAGKVFGFGVVQVPVYQRYNGLALAAHYTVSIGIRFIP